MLLAQEASQIGITVNELLPDRPFSFADFPRTKAQADKLLQKLTTNLETIIVNGVRSAWTLANNKNNELARRIFGDNVGKLTPTQYKRYFTNNEPARDAFIKRKTDGLTLSDRVWRYAEQFKAEIELGLDIGIRNGLSAQEMARDLKQYLNEPEKLFRRVRDQHGNLVLSKAAKAYHPGQGVYRSSHKNAMRLSRTENNMAYRYADFERWNNFDFVVGVEIRLSNNPNHCPMCAALAGKYRKDFKFGGWHPQCRCRALPILKTVEEMQKETDAILAGQQVPKDSVNTVSGMPANFNDWYAKNQERIDRAANKPYWLRDNEKLIQASLPQNQEEKPEKYELNTQTLKDLKRRDFSIRGDIEKYNILMGGFDLAAFDDDFMKLSRDNDIEFDFKTLNIGDEKIYLDYYSKDVRLERSFYINNKGAKEVHHDLFIIPAHIQGNGFSKKVFSDLYEQYRNAGIEIIDVQANIDIGGYTWARYGFMGKDQKSIGDVIRKAKGETLTLSEYEDFDKWLKSNSEQGRYNMRELSEKPYGKKLLLGTNWFGNIDLRNEAERLVFEKYLGR